jgi:hypothetical protein
MSRIINIFILYLGLTPFSACNRDAETDREKPEINFNIQDAFPINCDTLYFGESFTFRVVLTDNMELGSYSIDIHNNFDHHSHSTEVTECNLDPIKSPVNPFTFIEDFDIDEVLKEYVTNLSITIPSGNVYGLYDDGDYHFFISLTDKEGWSAQKGLSIKILQR